MQFLGGTLIHVIKKNTWHWSCLKKLTKLDGIQWMRKSFDTLLNWITQCVRRLIKSKQNEKNKNKTKQKNKQTNKLYCNDH